MTFHHLPKTSNLVGMASFKGISPRATAPPSPFPAYSPSNTAIHVTDPVEPHNILQVLIMSALSPTVIDYIVEMEKARQQEKENDTIPWLPDPIRPGLNQCHYHQTSECHSSECPTVLGTQLSTWLTISLGVGSS